MKPLYVNLTTLCVLLAFLIPTLVLMCAVMVERKRRRFSEKPPQQEKLLRPAGYSLAIRLEEIQDAMLEKLLIACVLCGIAGAAATTFASCMALPAPVIYTLVSGALLFVSGVAGTVLTLRVFRGFTKARNMRLGLRGEQAVAETLHEVGDCGYHAFHDLPGGENWNIDHIAVGVRGVFLIETKARRRRTNRDGKPEHVMIYDGKTMQFPSGQDVEATAQAQRNADWLVKYLTKKTGEPVAVEPMVVVPGWFIKTMGNFPVKVMNATYLAGYLRGQNEKLLPAQVRRIITALDEKCRDVEF